MLDVQKLIEPVKDSVSSLLHDIVENSQSINALVITQDGQHVLSHGDISFINTTALAALVAGMFTATREVAKLLGELEFSIIFQQGQKRNIHISLINRDLMLLVVYEGVEKTGEVRMNAATKGKAMAALMQPQAQPEAPRSAPVQPAKKPEPAEEVSKPAKPAVQKPEPEPAPRPAPPKPQPAPPDEKFDAFKEYASTLLDDIFGKD